MNVIVAFDISEQGIGAILLSKYKYGNMKSVIHASHLMIASEKKRISQIEEALSIFLQ